MVVSLLFGPVGVVTGFLGTTIFLVGLAEIGVNFATTAFLVAAGLRLYQDLREPRCGRCRLDAAIRDAADGAAATGRAVTTLRGGKGRES